jgi:ABC-type multidrug transport system fused ATPase/permease subunit
VVPIGQLVTAVPLADRIIVIDAGRIRAIGTHTELVTADTLYAELAATQLLTPAD